MNTYPKGSTIKVRWEFKDDSNNFVDPSNIYFRIKRPINITYAYGIDLEIVKDTVGKYYTLIVTNDDTDLWIYDVFSSGTASAHSYEMEFLVK